MDCARLNSTEFFIINKNLKPPKYSPVGTINHGIFCNYIIIFFPEISMIQNTVFKKLVYQRLIKYNSNILLHLYGIKSLKKMQTKLTDGLGW